MRKCPYCAESIQDEAIRCPHCRKNLSGSRLLLGIGVALFLGLLLAAFLLFFKREPANHEGAREVKRAAAPKAAATTEAHPPTAPEQGAEDRSVPDTQQAAKVAVPPQPGSIAETKDIEEKAESKTSGPEKLLAPVVRLENFAHHGTGSGFLVSADGYILTAAHVVEGASSIEVQHGGRKLSASVVAVETEGDVALLKVYEGDGASVFPFLPLGDATQLRVAAPVTVLGYPLGFEEPSVTKGIVSAVPAYFGSIAFPLIQMDAAINPGNSGGPVVDEHGMVVGIVTGKIGPAESINFATLVNAASRLPLPAAASLDGDRYRKWQETASDKAFMARSSAPDAAAVKIEEVYRDRETLMLAISLRNATGKPVRAQGNVTATVEFTTLKAGVTGTSHSDPCENSIRFKDRDYKLRNGVPTVLLPLHCKVLILGNILSITIKVQGDHIPQGDTIHYSTQE